MNKASDLIIPIIIVIILCVGLYKSRDVYGIFCSGVREGMQITVDIFPSILGLMMAIEMLNACGAIEVVSNFLKPVLNIIGMPEEVLPLALLRPISGSASIGIVNNVFSEAGVDSYAGKVASVMMGSTETTFYTIALFYGAVKEKIGANVVMAALVGDFVAMIGSIIFCRIFL